MSILSEIDRAMLEELRDQIARLEGNVHSLVADYARAVAERDEARRFASELLQRLQPVSALVMPAPVAPPPSLPTRSASIRGHRPRTCTRCPTIFTPTGSGQRLCPACFLKSRRDSAARIHAKRYGPVAERPQP